MIAFLLHRALSIDMMCGNQMTASVAKKGRSACARCGTFFLYFVVSRRFSLRTRETDKTDADNYESIF
jgi:hypothetical protein